MGKTTDKTFFAWMKEKHVDLWADVFKASVEFNLNLHALEFEKIPMLVTGEGNLDQLSIRRTIKIFLAEVHPPVGADNRGLYDGIYD